MRRSLVQRISNLTQDTAVKTSEASLANITGDWGEDPESSEYKPAQSILGRARPSQTKPSQLLERADWSFVTDKIQNKWLKRFITPETVPIFIMGGISLCKHVYNKIKDPNLISITIAKKDYSRAWDAMLSYLRYQTKFFDDYIEQLKLSNTNFKKALEDPKTRNPKTSRIKPLVLEFIDAHLPSNHTSEIMFKGVEITISKISETTTQAENGVTIYSNKKELVLSVSKEHKGILTDFLNTVVDYHYENHLKFNTMVHVNTSSGWRCNNELHARPLDSVFIPQDKKDALLEDLNKFLDRSERLKQKGLSPYRTYLFHGIPGSGKTTMIKTLATYLNRDVYFLSLGDVSNKELSTLISDLSSDAILVIEEIDVAYSKRDMNKGTSASFDSILNLLDGLTSKDNLITFITTNKYTSLDSALLRAGRVSMELEFNYMEKEEILKMVEYWTDRKLSSKEQEKVLKSITPGNYRASLVESFLFTFNTFEEFITNISKFEEYVQMNHKSDVIK